jgi:Ca2+-transporting ATPase
MEKEKGYYSKSKEELFSEFKTSEKGLSTEQVEKRLEIYGKNVIKKTHRLRPLKIFIQQFNSFLIYILIIAAIISFFIKHNIDGIVISAIIILNAIIGFFQQYRAEKAIEDLKQMLIPMSKVIRNNIMVEIHSEELVPGDIMVLTEGDRINADARILESENLQTNEAVLTGESLPVDKFSEKISSKKNLAEQKNMVFAGTQVVRGETKALVVFTNMETAFGKIAASLQEIKIQNTPMQNRLDKFSKQVGIFILMLVGVVMALGIFDKFDFTGMFLTAVVLAVSAIPEGLPAVLTISFAISSLAMSKKNVIIRRLPAVESLGSVTVICSDKTGTITEEKMNIQEIFANNKIYQKEDKSLFFKGKKINVKEHKEIFWLLKTSVLCNNARFEIIKDKYEIIGDPTEETLLLNSLDLGLNKKLMIEQEPSIKKFEFDSKRKMMSIIRDAGRNNIMYSKGAIEKILHASEYEFVNGKIEKLNDKRKKEILSEAKKMEEDALRVLAFAFKKISKEKKAEENNLIFLGFTGMIDPPRKEVKEAVRQCKLAGIKIKMITGDSIITAMAVAKKIGIIGKAITEDELEKMSDEELKQSIDSIAIFARTTPHQKLRITTILQSKGEVVAITGDGVNDALALKSADIGIAMGKRGTDVSREVSDLVLMDDNFSSIVEGVKQGRKTYDNIKKFTKFFLTVNFSEIFLVLTALILGILFGQEKWILPLLPLQILWINLVTDSLPAMSLIFEKEESVMKTQPRKERSLLDNSWKFIIVAGIFTFAVKISMYFFGIASELSEIKIRTMVLTTAILFELLFVYTFRSDEPLLKRGIFSNKLMNWSILISIILHLILIYSPLSTIFQTTALSLSEWLFILPFAFSGLIVFEIGKYVKLKNKLKQAN